MYHMVLIVERIICYMFGLSLASRINKVWIINFAKNPTRPLNEWSEVGYVFMSHILIPVSIIVSLILTLVMKLTKINLYNDMLHMGLLKYSWIFFFYYSMKLKKI